MNEGTYKQFASNNQVSNNIIRKYLKLLIIRYYYNNNSYVSLTRENNYHKNTLTKNIEILLRDIIDSHDSINSLYHIATIFSEKEDRLHGYIVAPTNLKQMQDILNFLANVNVNDINLDSLKNLNKI